MARLFPVRSMLSAGLACFIAASGCGDINDAGEDGPAVSAEAQASPVRASLALKGEDLLITLRNGTDREARVSLSAVVNSRIINSRGELGSVTVPAGQTIEHLVKASALKGFDVAGSAWLRTELYYDYNLTGGARGRRVTGLATRAGAMVPPAEAVNRGLALADTALEAPLVAAAAALGTFKVCVKNALVFNHVNGFSSHGLSPDLTADTNTLAMPGQFLYAYYNRPGSTPKLITGGNVDASGCFSGIPRQTTGAESWTIRPILYVVSGPTTFTASPTDGTNGGQDLVVSVSSGGTVSPATSTMSFTAGSESQLLQTAMFIASYTATRAATLGVTPGANNLALSTTDPAQTSHYCGAAFPDPADDCPAALTLRLARKKANGQTDANDREVIAHETGHWIHHMNIGTFPPDDYRYSNADAAPLSPTESTFCRSARDGMDVHDFGTIEWQSAAHTEGIANFFGAVAYNPVSRGAACTFRGNDCERAGKTLSSCTEWSTANFFRAGNELDWTKMLWDYVADKGGDMTKFLAAEHAAAIDGWPADGHSNLVDPIWNHLAAIDANQRHWLNDAAGGNIFDGTPDFVCSGNNGIPTGTAPGSVCCLKSCGTCGGGGCGSRPGGSNGCCTGGIIAADRSCAPNVAPCVIR